MEFVVSIHQYSKGSSFDSYQCH